MCDLALNVFQYETLREIMGFDYMDAEDQERFDDGLALLKSDKQRKIRVDIETDSTILLNEDEERAMKVDLINSVGQFMQNTARAIKEEPALATPMMSILMTAVRGFRQGKQSEDEIQSAFNQLLDQMNQPPPPPPPNIDLMKVENERLRIEGELGIKEAESQRENVRLALDEQESRFNQYIRGLEFQLDKQSKNIEMYEKLIEEQRLQLQNVLMPEQRDMYVQQQTQQSQQVDKLLGLVNALMAEKEKPKVIEIDRDIFTGKSTVRIMKDLQQLQ
jgi:hypothetical protein